MSKNLKNISVVSGLTMLSRVLGLVRESLTAAVFGVNALISAYFTGFTLPNLFRRLLAEGGLTAAFVPTLNEELHARDRDGAFRLVNQVMSWLLVVSSILVLVSMALLNQSWLVRAAAHAVHADAAAVERWQLAAWFAVFLFPYLIFVSLAAVFSGALQTLHRFVEPALSPVWLNLSMIGLLFAGVRWGHHDQVCWFASGTLLGGFLQMAVPAGALMNEGWRPRFDFRVNDTLKAMLRLMAPTVFSSSIYLVNMSVSRLVGLSLNDAAVAVLNFAQRLMELPIGVFAVAVSTVVFPLISRYAVAGDRENLAHAYRRGMRLILLINIPAAVGLGVLALPIIRVLFQHGRFNASATEIMTPVLIANALGLPFLSFANLALRAFYAQKDTVIPVRAAMLSLIVNLALSFALMKPLSTVGLAIASTVASAVQAIYLQVHLSRKEGRLAFHHLSGDLWKVVFASLLMGAAVALARWGWGHLIGGGRISEAIGIAVMIGVGVVVYGSLVWTMRIGDREEIVAFVEKLRGKLRFR